MSEIANKIAFSLHPTASRLSDHARRYSAASLRPTTRRAYAAALKGWLQWRDQEELEPANPVDVANYIAERAAAGQSLSTLRTIIAALKAGHEAKGWTFDSSSPVISRVLRGIANLEYRLPRQAEPLHGAALLRILNAITSVEKPSIIDRCNAALLALGYLPPEERSTRLLDGTASLCPGRLISLRPDRAPPSHWKPWRDAEENSDRLIAKRSLSSSPRAEQATAAPEKPRTVRSADSRHPSLAPRKIRGARASGQFLELHNQFSDRLVYHRGETSDVSCIERIAFQLPLGSRPIPRAVMSPHPIGARDHVV